MELKSGTEFCCVREPPDVPPVAQVFIHRSGLARIVMNASVVEGSKLNVRILRLSCLPLSHLSIGAQW